MIKQNTLLLLMLVLLIGCSNQPTNDGMISLEEYDEGLNLKVYPVLSLQDGQIIEFSIPGGVSYTLTIMNATGYTVRIYTGTASAGITTITWDLTNNDNKGIKEGIYIYEAESGGGVKAREVFVIREDK